MFTQCGELNQHRCLQPLHATFRRTHEGEPGLPWPLKRWLQRIRKLKAEQREGPRGIKLAPTVGDQNKTDYMLWGGAFCYLCCCCFFLTFALYYSFLARSWQNLTLLFFFPGSWNTAAPLCVCHKYKSDQFLLKKQFTLFSDWGNTLDLRLYCSKEEHIIQSVLMI